jgi:CHRD domain-containing protein/lectin family protein
MKGFFGVVFWLSGYHWEFLGSHPRFTQITGGTAMLRLPVFISLVGLLILLSGNATQPAQAQTTLPRFNLVNNAVLLEDRLRLTVNEGRQTGAAWLPDKQQVQDGFEVTFGWQINRANPRRGAEGFAFVLHNADGQPFPHILIGEGRHGLGYQGIPNSLAVEFDTVQTPSADFGAGTRGDPNGNHISVQTRGTEPNNANTDFSLGYTTQGTPAIPLFADGSVHTTKVAYKPGTLTISLDDLTKPVLTVPVDLGTKLSLDEGKAWVGFTGATGRRFQAHDILSFSFVGAEDSNNFTAQLDGGQEVPPRTTEATGEATFQFREETQLDFTLTVFNVQNLVAAHIHCAPAGENGAVGVTLYGPVAPGGGAVDTFSTEGTITAPDAGNGCEWADVAAVVEAMRSGTAYVNVHTDDGDDPPDTGPGDFPGGEIRGQIEAAVQE